MTRAPCTPITRPAESVFVFACEAASSTLQQQQGEAAASSAPAAAAPSPPQLIQTFLQRPDCTLLRRRARHEVHTVSCEERINAADAQAMLAACSIEPEEAIDSSQSMPETTSLLLAILRYLEAMQEGGITHTADLVRRVSEVFAIARSLIDEVRCLLGGLISGIHANESTVRSNHGAAWRVLIESGACIDVPYFLRLLRLHSSSRSVASRPTLDEVISMLQSFVRHFTTETVDPLVQALNDSTHLWHALPSITPADHDDLPMMMAPPCHRRAQKSAPEMYDGTPRPTLRASTSFSFADSLWSQLLSLRAPMVTALQVHRLFMRLGAERMDRVGALLTSAASDDYSAKRFHAWGELEECLLQQL